MTDPIALLKKDHREAAAAFKTLAASKPGARRNATVKKLDAALKLQMQIEEKLTAGIKHHVREEEREVFPELKAKLDRDELARLGDEVKAAKSTKKTSR